MGAARRVAASTRAKLVARLGARFTKCGWNLGRHEGHERCLASYLTAHTLLAHACSHFPAQPVKHSRAHTPAGAGAGRYGSQHARLQHSGDGARDVCRAVEGDGTGAKAFRLCSSCPALSWRTRAGLAGVCGGGQAAGAARGRRGRVGRSRTHSAAQRGDASPHFQRAVRARGGGPQHPLGGWVVAGG